MELYKEGRNYKIYHSDMRNMLENIPENSIDCIVCDPPYGLTSIVNRFSKEKSENYENRNDQYVRLAKGFMGKEWDGSGVEYDVSAWEQCLKVLKPGGYLLAFGGSRTFHRIACAIEDAGFEIRDTIMWLYGSGFPKSMSLSKGLEAREKLGNAGTRNKRKIEQSCDSEEYTLKQTNNGAMGEVIETTRKKYKPDTELAKQWDGWGTCLKPSYEPIIVARKPFKGSLVDNIIANGVGGLNIDECRVGTEIIKGGTMPVMGKGETGVYNYNIVNAERVEREDSVGRFPANTILTYDDTDFEEVCGGMPNTKSTYNIKGKHEKEIHRKNEDVLKYGYKEIVDSCSYNDSGSASRYFYCAKASKKDRDEGLEEFEEQKTGELQGGRKEGSAGSIMLNKDGGARVNPYAGTGAPKKNTHPTVKPTELMQYLVRLVAPQGATILDPFMGSGSTGKAVMYENLERNKNYKFIGIEMTEEYLPIATARIECADNLSKKENNFDDMLFELLKLDI